MKINGKPVVDAKSHLEITVIKADCQRGKMKDAASCAAALAIIRSVPGVIGARVNRGITVAEFKDHWKRYKTPTSLATELTVFDRGAKFEPGKHTLGKTADTSVSQEAQRERDRVAAKKRRDQRLRHDAPDAPRRKRHEIPAIRRKALR